MSRASILAALALSMACLPCRAAPRATDVAPAPERLWAQAMLLHLWFGDHAALKPPEAMQTLSAILRGSSMGPGSGWFHPSRSRYDWNWLAARFKVPLQGHVARQDWPGPVELFVRLDRDGDGVITAADLDWSPQSPWVRQASMTQPWFNRMDANTNGRVTREEWSAFFDSIAGDKGYLTPDDLRRLASGPPTGPPVKAGSAKAAPKAPSKGKDFTATLLKALFNNELGSPYEGPRVGEEAPDFILPTPDGKQTISLAEFRGKKPVVLIFGSFT